MNERIILGMKQLHLKVNAYDSAYRCEDAGPKDDGYAELAFRAHLELPNHNEGNREYGNIGNRVEYRRGYV